MNNRPIDAHSILKSLSDLSAHLDATSCLSLSGAEASSFELGSLSDNLAFIDIAALYIRQDNLVDGVAMLMQLVTHVVRSGETKSSHCLLPVIGRMAGEVTDLITGRGTGG